ncbi:MAG: 50S ribosomal protein L13 [Candidatus Paceibacterota bacterium]|jgi:large subunit ribosomal protein L13
MEKENKKIEEYLIDANEKTLGRTATQAASFLMGKNDTNFAKNKVSGNKVKIINASKIVISPKKMISVEHERYSGYPGGLKTQTVADIISKKGYTELFILAVYGMLPNNKLKSKMMKNLQIVE